jgi:hypothetical protein
LNSFGDRFGNGPAIPEAIAPRNPSLPVPPPQIRKPLGIFSGEPMPGWPVPPPIWDLPDDRQSRGEDNGDWLMGLLRSVGAY